MKSQYSLKQEKVFFFQARESFLYIRHGLASVGANNVFAKCVLANCEKRSLLGNCQPSVNREGSCASLWWRWSAGCLDRSEPGGDRAPLTHRHPHTMRITPSSSRQNIFIVPSMLLSTWLVGPGQHLQTFYKEEKSKEHYLIIFIQNHLVTGIKHHFHIITRAVLNSLSVCSHVSHSF